MARMVNSNVFSKQILPYSRAGIYMKDTELDKSKYNPAKAENLMKLEWLSGQLHDKNLSDEDRAKLVAEIKELKEPLMQQERMPILPHEQE
jgi:hypothetical protein